MEHPLKDRKIIYYGGLWVLIMVLHATFLFYQFNFPFTICIADSVVFNLSIAIACFLYWYVVKFISPQRQGMTETLIAHLIGVGFSVILLTHFSGQILKVFFEGDIAYRQFYKSSILFRVLLGMLYFATTILLYYLLLYVENINEQIKKEVALQDLLKQTSLDMLMFQINPHFLFNSLNSISALTITSPTLAREMVIKLADFFRASLNKQNNEMQTLKEELAQMNLYLDIEKVRFENRLIIENSIDEACFELLVPKMILQPLYENAIKYGVYEELGKTTIKTNCACSEDALTITISNEAGAGMRHRKGTGLGISNVKERLKLIYGIDHLVKVNYSDGVFTIGLTIPRTIST